VTEVKRYGAEGAFQPFHKEKCWEEYNCTREARQRG